MGIEGIENLQEEGASKDDSAAPPIDVNPNQAETPSGPTTSPDVVITNDPGPPPEGDAPVDDDTHSDVQPIDPPSDDTVEKVDPLADESA